MKEKFIPVLVILAIGLAFFSGTLWQKVKNLEKGQSTTTVQPTAKAQPKVSLETIKSLFDKDLIKIGDKDSKVIFVEISDPSCPYCQAAAGLNPTLNNQMGPQFKLVKDGGTYVAPVIEMKKLVDAGKASFVWIYSPGHGNGELGTKALYCANEKGKFWEAQDLLMTSKGYDLLNNTIKNDITKSGILVTFLKSAVDSTFLKECLDSGKYDARLANDTQIASSLGFQGTPDFFVNDKNFAGAVSYEQMRSVVDAALK
ncbi:MAG: Periplasmic thiol:disulfide interchange protein DsbA [Candidatus Amesbacteria bacterium GW2011_GWC1_46_24]|nr:MAG: Periplasmic thiol:disulfide interchange protein DsbA [Candidatus Amesbacteria bacterium GW2011_GWC1_46_24]